MIILGITGPIGHGKSTCASSIVAARPGSGLYESHGLVAEAANALNKQLAVPFAPSDIDAINLWLTGLPQVIADVLHVKSDFAKLRIIKQNVLAHPIEYEKLFLYLHNVQRDFSITNTSITDSNKEIYRPLMQWLGGYLVQHVDQGIWYNELYRRAQEHPEAPFAIFSGLRYPNDANIVRAAGGKIIKVFRSNMPQTDVLDPTERERGSIRFDVQLDNNGSLQQLQEACMRLVEDAENQQLKPLYKAVE